MYHSCYDISLTLMLFTLLPNEELSVLYGGPTLNYGGQLSLYAPYMLRVNMTVDLAHMQLSDLQGETRPICRTSELPGGTVGVCSFHRRCGQLPFNLPITPLRFTPRSLQVCLLAHFNKCSIYE